MGGRAVNIVGIIALALVGFGACANKSFVTDRVSEVNDRVDGLSKTQAESEARSEARARRIDGWVGEVDETATAALESSERSHALAMAADDSANDAHGRLDVLVASSRRLLFEIVIADAHGEFAFADATLPGPAQAVLDTLVEQLADYPVGVYLEIEGHADSTGPVSYNERLGLRRAQSVLHYLHDQHHVPLHKMSVISYGEERPITTNNTKEGRAQNRRVVVRVLA